MGVAHALANHRAQGALLQKPTHPAKQLGSDPLLSGDFPDPAANLMICIDFFDFKSKSI
jgi:hypothetical protein